MGNETDAEVSGDARLRVLLAEWNGLKAEADAVGADIDAGNIADQDANVPCYERMGEIVTVALSIPAQTWNGVRAKAILALDRAQESVPGIIVATAYACMPKVFADAMPLSLAVDVLRLTSGE